METISDSGLCVGFYPNFYSEDEATALYTEIDKYLDKGKSKRSSKSFGEAGLEYVIHWYGKTTVRKLIDWTKYPILLKIRDKLTAVVPEDYNTVVVQRYPSGKCGIKPHRDKEMKRGTVIAGLSLGQTRTLALQRGSKTYKLTLTPGSLYILRPPTNDLWSHCIEEDDSVSPRISLTYRNYR